MMKRTLFYSLAAISAGIGISLLLVEGFLRIQNFMELDGFAEKGIGHPVFHHGDGTFSVENFGSECGAEATKVLLLGDSWMEDPVLSGTLAEEFSRETGECVRAVNGGKSSYSPTIYLLKAREAGVNILDARGHIREIHGNAFWSDTFEENDPFSHLASNGATRYGVWIAESLSEGG